MILPLPTYYTVVYGVVVGGGACQVGVLSYLTTQRENVLKAKPCLSLCFHSYDLNYNKSRCYGEDDSDSWSQSHLSLALSLLLLLLSSFVLQVGAEIFCKIVCYDPVRFDLNRNQQSYPGMRDHTHRHTSCAKKHIHLLNRANTSLFAK